jgi:uncharacterized protein YbjT (DUF2867 family)
MILITGATGTVGVRLTAELLAEGVPFGALVRDPRRAAQVLGPEVDLLKGDYERPETLRAALAGIDRLFLISPLTPRLAEQERNVIDAAARAGVGHVVKLSTLGVLGSVDGLSLVPEPRQYPLHRLGEGRLERSGMAFTHLRPGPFMQNVLSFAPQIASEGAFYGSWGDGRMGYVDVGDVAAVAARVLTEDGHERKAYGITGPEALSQAEVAEKLSAATRRGVRYIDVPPEAAREAMLGRGMPEWLAGAIVELMASSRRRGADETYDGVTLVTGRSPRSFDDFAHEFAPMFEASLSRSK